MKFYSGDIIYSGRRYRLGSETEITKREVLDVYEVKTDPAGNEYVHCLYALKDEDPAAYVLLSALNAWKHLAEELMAEAGMFNQDQEERLRLNGLIPDTRKLATNPEPF